MNIYEFVDINYTSALSKSVCGSVLMKHEFRSLDSQWPLVETDDRQDSYLLEHLVEDEPRQHEGGQQQLLLVSTMSDTGCCLSTVHCSQDIHLVSLKEPASLMARTKSGSRIWPSL